MLKERKKLLAHRLTWLVLLISLVLFVIFFKLPHPNFKIVSDSCSLNYYNEDSDTSSCSMTVTFNQDVDECDITVAFYDRDERLIETKEILFYVYGDTAEESYISVNGYADSYKIVSFQPTFQTDDLVNYLKIYLGSALIFLAFVFWICSLIYNYKYYNIFGYDVIVYAGPYHHYIKISGRIYDEHNTLMSWTPITLSTNLGSYTIQATISLSNRIALKLNNILIRPTK